jgi:hypothetical protein
MTPIYRATVLLAPVVEEGSQSSNLSRLVGSLGGLANLAGLSLAGGSTNKEESIATLQSRAFTEQFIEEQGLLPALFPDRWDVAEEKWIGGSPGQAPSIAAGYYLFNDARTVSVERLTGFLTLSIEWPQRELAAEWANSLVDQLNEHLRLQAIHQAQESIEYLNRELEKTSVVGIRQGIFALVQQQVNKIMLANVRDEYAFKVLDPAYVPGEKSFVRPRRSLIIALGVVIGLMLGGAVALIRDAYVQRARD